MKKVGRRYLFGHLSNCRCRAQCFCPSLTSLTPKYTMLPTGDLRGNVQRVIDHLKLVSYHLPVSSRSLKAGETTSLLPILHYTLLDFSPHVASFVSSHGYDLYGRDDATFTTAVFRLATLHLGIQPGLQAQQFLSRGFIGEQRAQALRSPFSGGVLWMQWVALAGGRDSVSSVRPSRSPANPPHFLPPSPPPSFFCSMFI